MKLELSDGMSNNSDFSNDSQNSQMSTADFLTSMANGTLLTPTFITLEGLNSGVPTRTTPTLTPTTLRNIEQTFIELQTKPETHENEAGFVPPLVHSIGNNQYISASDPDIYTISNNTSKSTTIWQSSSNNFDWDNSQCSDSDSETSPTPGELSSMMHTPPQTSRRNMGGRKPNKDYNISAEEEERRKVRRERNKAAAARCRKRRVDHTNQLVDETDDLERRKQELQKEYDDLHTMKDQLEYLLECHRPKCRGVSQNRPNMQTQQQQQQHLQQPNSPPDVKPFTLNTHNIFNTPSPDRVKTELVDHPIPVDDDLIFCQPSPAKRIMLSSALPLMLKPSRPNTLNVAATAPFTNLSKQDVSELAGIAITTPSTGIQFNFDSLMVGGTGLTPVSAPLIPNCSTQNRIPVSCNNNDINSPESNKLVSL